MFTYSLACVVVNVVAAMVSASAAPQRRSVPAKLLLAWAATSSSDARADVTRPDRADWPPEKAIASRAARWPAACSVIGAAAAHWR